MQCWTLCAGKKHTALSTCTSTSETFPLKVLHLSWRMKRGHAKSFKPWEYFTIWPTLYSSCFSRFREEVLLILVLIPWKTNCLVCKTSRSKTVRKKLRKKESFLLVWLIDTSPTVRKWIFLLLLLRIENLLFYEIPKSCIDCGEIHT